MRRRDFIIAAGGSFAWLPRARAQQRASMPVVGYFGVGSPGPFADRIAAFRDGLRRTGFVEGRNVAIDFRWTEAGYDRLPALAAELGDRRGEGLVTGNAAVAIGLFIWRRPCSIRAGRESQQTGFKPDRRKSVCVFFGGQALSIAA